MSNQESLLEAVLMCCANEDKEFKGSLAKVCSYYNHGEVLTALNTLREVMRSSMDALSLLVDMYRVFDILSVEVIGRRACCVATATILNKGFLTREDLYQIWESVPQGIRVGNEVLGGETDIRALVATSKVLAVPFLPSLWSALHNQLKPHDKGHFWWSKSID